MVLSTLGVAADVTPSVIETFFSHASLGAVSQYLNRKPLKGKPTAHVSYHEGLRLIRQFLHYASQHTVEDIQAFTGQWVPTPTWVKLEEVAISEAHLKRSADLVKAQLGPAGLQRVGGQDWWQWRRPELALKGEWIEMRQDYNDRVATENKSDRVILYVHGGAYYFGSVDEHRYQMQRHARKLKARLFAPRYRLAPQFPFPCGLHDCIAAYLHVIEQCDPSTVLLGGDSAGGGMVINMLVTLRDQGLPLPAGALLLSPWVDLTHSFPSVAGEGDFDYIPANGFHHRPSMAWPPPNANDLKDIKSPQLNSPRRSKEEKKKLEREATQGFTTEDMPPIGEATDTATAGQTFRPRAKSVPGGEHLSIELDGKLIELTDQIQMYTTNDMLAHPMVSPVMQPSLGGLPPLLIQTGGGELLRDEQIYIAHKAANPAAYLPSKKVMDEFDPNREILNRYPPTHVVLQVWDDLCHVPHTLSFTRPAKYMYRSVAQFGAWALACAQDQAITILDDDAISIISTQSSDESDKDSSDEKIDRGRTMDKKFPDALGTPIRAHAVSTASGSVGKAGDPLPPFQGHMVRQRVDRHGVTYPLAAPSDLQCLQLDPNTIGMIKPGPVRKWISKKAEWDVKYGKDKRAIQKQRMKEMAEGYDTFKAGDVPPPTALAGRRKKDMPGQKTRKGKSWGLAMWSGWGSKHDEDTIGREQKVNRAPTQSVAVPQAGAGVSKVDPEEAAKIEASPMVRPSPTFDRSMSPSYRTVTNLGQTGLPHRPMSSSTVPPTPPPKDEPRGKEAIRDDELHLAPYGMHTKVPGSENTFLSNNSARPHNGEVAYPFKLKNEAATASTVTLDSAAHVRPMGRGDGESVVESSRPTTGKGVSVMGGSEDVIIANEPGVGVYETETGLREKGKGRAADNEVEGGAARPALQTFVTAQEF
ncbi:alpha/beta-hydrolase [Aureobasidium subglaciale]|nr:alpha/beta-hydrolase [Aureobasidium subglaciale]KAI5223806.1 alpha/beta-hydrolase [Aureobasidium subglaciale]KAI5227118.1 alpha/beta-hydrolase [Aureobasidium subglaciale]KAI5262601.1 alpha/beta-hydrolase [Aureobasidium subglaciale]